MRYAFTSDNKPGGFRDTLPKVEFTISFIIGIQQCFPGKGEELPRKDPAVSPEGPTGRETLRLCFSHHVCVLHGALLLPTRKGAFARDCLEGTCCQVYMLTGH